MKYLVNVNVISEATKPQPHIRVVSWLRHHVAELVLEPVVLGEVRHCIRLLPTAKRRRLLETWFDQRVTSMVCLAWVAATALRWAELLAKPRAKGPTMPLKDSMIAASALTHGLTVATRNVVEFRKAGVTVVNPFWKPGPSSSIPKPIGHPPERRSPSDTPISRMFGSAPAVAIGCLPMKWSAMSGYRRMKRR